MNEQNKYVLARAFSMLLHPLMMPLYLGIIYLFLPPFAYSTVASNKIIYLCTIILFFQIIPVGTLVICKKRGIITSINLRERNERFTPMVAVFLSFFVGLFILQKLMAPAILVLLIKGICAAILIVAAVSIVWKISAHLTGVGGAFAIIFILSITNRIDLSSWAFIMAIYSGILGWARLYLKCHDKYQIYAGFLTGFSTVFAAFALNI